MLIIAALIVLIITLGVAGLVGFVTLVIVVPISGFLMKIAMKVRKANNVLTDERVKLTQECVAGIRVVKFNAWEEAILGRINEIRKKEMANTRRLLIIRASLSAMVNAQPVFASVCMFATYTALGGTMTIARTFSAVALMQVVRYPSMFLPVSTGRHSSLWGYLMRIASSCYFSFLV